MSTNYYTTKDNLRSTLDRFGVAIIPSVLNDNECIKMISDMWDFFEHITSKWPIPIDRNNKDTWRYIYELQPIHSMLFQYHSVGHCQASWNLRENMKIVDIYAKLWNCAPDELLVSFDGLSFNIPPEVTKRGWNRNNLWVHTDQSYTRNDFECVQSWVTGLDVEKGDATLLVYEGSHKYHKEFADKFGITDKGDWHKLDEEENKFYFDKGCEMKRIECPKGSMVFWDSRTIHCGVEANRDRAIEKLRAVIYLCYMPRSVSTNGNIKKKKTAFDELRTTSHWPSKIKLFPKKPRFYNNSLPTITPIAPPVVSTFGKKLAGF